MFIESFIGMLSLALDTELSDVARDHIDSALECTHFLLNIINTLLDFSKLEAKHVQLTPVHFPLRTSLGTVLSITVKFNRTRSFFSLI